MKPLGILPDKHASMQAAVTAPASDHYSLCLYVTASASPSARAISNIRKICEKHLTGRYDLEIVNIAERPELMAENQIIATPTLVKILPLPSRRFIGDMSQTDRILLGLGLYPKPAIVSPTTNI
jgi:circadian clock protein KaiB